MPLKSAYVFAFGLDVDLQSIQKHGIDTNWLSG